MVVKFYVLLILEVSSIDLLNLKSFSKIRDVSAGKGRGCKNDKQGFSCLLLLSIVPWLLLRTRGSALKLRRTDY